MSYTSCYRRLEEEALGYTFGSVICSGGHETSHSAWKSMNENVLARQFKMANRSYKEIAREQCTIQVFESPSAWSDWLPKGESRRLNRIEDKVKSFYKLSDDESVCWMDVLQEAGCTLGPV